MAKKNRSEKLSPTQRLHQDASAEYASARQLVETSLAIGRPSATLKLTERLHYELDRDLRQFGVSVAKGLGPQGPPPACSAGCDHCCYQLVGAFAFEVFSAAAFINAHFSAEERDDLLGRIQDSRLKQSELEEPRSAEACPLLVNHACSIYPSRPMVCRTYHSLDVRPCIQKRNAPTEAVSIPRIIGLDMHGYAYNSATQDALATLKKPSPFVNFALALEFVLRNPDCAEAWEKGEDILQPYALPITREAFSQLLPSEA